MVSLLLAAAAAAAQPSAEALKLGREIAGHGTLAALLPLKQEQDTRELLDEAKDLTPAEQAQLRATVERHYSKGKERLFAATGRVYAEKLSLKDLRAIAAFYRSAAAARFQTVVPTAIATTMQQVGDVDVKKDARAAFCKETGKLCGK